MNPLLILLICGNNGLVFVETKAGLVSLGTEVKAEHDATRAAIVRQKNLIFLECCEITPKLKL